MLTTVGLALGFFAVLIAFLSVGLFFGRKPISGSCGGLAGGDGCSVCGATGKDACAKEEAH